MSRTDEPEKCSTNILGMLDPVLAVRPHHHGERGGKVKMEMTSVCDVSRHLYPVVLNGEKQFMCSIVRWSTVVSFLGNQVIHLVNA